jgi:HEAT repeat protein
VLSHRRLAVALIVALAGVAAAPVRADLVRLRNGGEIRGEVDKSEGVDGPTVTIESLSGIVVTVPRDEVEFVTYRRLVVEEYETRDRHTPHEVAAQWELAEWCKQQGLVAERERHLERVVELETDHAEARKALRHVRQDGVWMSREESMRRQGYVEYRRRWITPEELALIEQTEAERDAEQEWYANVRRLVIGLEHRSPQRRQEAVAELSLIADPHAVPALVKNLAEHENKAVRLLYVNVLGNVPGGAGVGPLVDRSLYDANYEVRYRAVNVLVEENRPAAAGLYVQSLKSDDNQVVRRAANALARFGGEQVVPDLVDALVTRHEYRVAQQSTGDTLGFRTDGGGMVNPGQTSLPPDLQALAQSGGAIVRTPTNPHARVKWVNVKYDVRNAEVLTALVKLTGQDFGYDERTWRLWWASKKNLGG